MIPQALSLICCTAPKARSALTRKPQQCAIVPRSLPSGGLWFGYGSMDSELRQALLLGWPRARPVRSRGSDRARRQASAAQGARDPCMGCGRGRAPDCAHRSEAAAAWIHACRAGCRSVGFQPGFQLRPMQSECGWKVLVGRFCKSLFLLNENNPYKANVTGSIPVAPTR